MGGAVHVIGATGRSGLALCRALHARGRPAVPVVRDPARWIAGGLCGVPRRIDLEQPDGLASALADAEDIVSTAHARYLPTILAAAPAGARLVALGSTRKFTRWPDAHGNGVLAGEAAFLASGRAGMLLHPSMIYGAAGEDNVQRLVVLLRRLPFVPLPGGGRALVQPIHQSDVTRAILAALAAGQGAPRSLVIAGPAPIAYADFVRAVARAGGLPPPRIFPVAAAPLMLAAPLVALLPRLPRIRAAEIRRMLEDKAFDIAPMRRQLGIEPMPLEAGLALTLRA